MCCMEKPEPRAKNALLAPAIVRDNAARMTKLHDHINKHTKKRGSITLAGRGSNVYIMGSAHFDVLTLRLALEYSGTLDTTITLGAFKALIDLYKAASGQVVLQVSDDKQLRVVGATGGTGLEASADAPLTLRDTEGLDGVQPIPWTPLKQALSLVEGMQSTDHTAREHLCGVLIDKEHVVATDGFVLSAVERKGCEDGCYVPTFLRSQTLKAIHALATLGTQELQFVFGVAGSRTIVGSDGWSVLSSLVGSTRFPDWEWLCGGGFANRSKEPTVVKDIPAADILSMLKSSTLAERKAQPVIYAFVEILVWEQGQAQFIHGTSNRLIGSSVWGKRAERVGISRENLLRVLDGVDGTIDMRIWDKLSPLEWRNDQQGIVRITAPYLLGS